MDAIWTPSIERKTKSALHQFAQIYYAESDYNELHKKSIDDPLLFWKNVIHFFQLKVEGEQDFSYHRDFKNYHWFPELKLNFAENLLKKGEGHDLAFTFVHESGLSRQMNYAELNNEVSILAAFLSDYIQEKDVVAAYMPNLIETPIAMLAAAALGAIFTSTSIDFGVSGVVDRFFQSSPSILVTAIGYEYNGKYFDQTEKIKELKSKLPSLKKILVVDFLNKTKQSDLFLDPDILSFDQIMKDYHFKNRPLTFIKRPFSHPLYIMYSSGTTGVPKCIVHTQGGVLLTHVKELGLHCDLNKSKKISFFTTCGWMMWNWLISSLSFGAHVVLYEGSPAAPSPKAFFNLIHEEKINIFGTSPKFLKVLQDTGTTFGHGFPSLETLLSTGSPLLDEQYDYVYEHLKKDLLLGSISGGTDIVGCFMLCNPLLAVYRGEIQAKALGMDVQAFNDDGCAVVEEVGELVCTASFPSRPLEFLNDPSGEKMAEAYFQKFPGVWAHGDFVKVTSRGGVIVYGRSDATLNPGGVRIGTAEIYRQTEKLSFIEDSLCIGVAKNGDVDIILFVKLKTELTSAMAKEIRQVIRTHTTPRHVPKEIIQVKDIPYTRSGKKVELAVHKIFLNKAIQNTEALANPESLDEYRIIATKLI